MKLQTVLITLIFVTLVSVGFQYHQINSARTGFHSFTVACDAYRDSLTKARALVVSLHEKDGFDQNWKHLQAELDTTEHLLTSIMASPHLRQRSSDDTILTVVTEFAAALVDLAERNPECRAIPELADRCSTFANICNSCDR